MKTTKLESRADYFRKYYDKIRAKGWVNLSLYVPPEIKIKMLSYRDELLKEYKESHPEN